MNGWIKHYADGGQYVGDDRDVYAGRASWRKSSFRGLIRVDLVVGDDVRSLSGVGEYWQSDEFEALFPAGTKMVKRRIQKRIEPGESSNPSDVGKWFTVEYDCQTKQWAYRLTEGKL